MVLWILITFVIGALFVGLALWAGEEGTERLAFALLMIGLAFWASFAILFLVDYIILKIKLASLIV